MIQVTQAGITSLPVVAALYGAAFGDDWPESSLRTLLSIPGTEALLACSNSDDIPTPSFDDPMGFVLFRRITDEGEIISIGVRPDRRQEGVATALLNAAHKALIAGMARSVFLEVGADNPEAIRLYSRLGYERVGLRKQYYRRASGVKVDAIVMKLRLERNGLK